MPVVWDTQLGRFVKNDNPMYGIGTQRALGMATTLTVVPTATVESAKWIYDVTKLSCLMLSAIAVFTKYSVSSSIPNILKISCGKG